ncbi:MAG: alpha/beta fold hydrolase, partial [Prolixibacteraceae bacterium]|nr:alpha/beta fold hydrolase [Prolixibacteraceae bacterium]
MNLYYRIEGEGTPLVILHGLYGSSDNWMQIARMIKGYQVIAVDHRNHGASPHSTDNHFDDMVSDLAWLFHELEIEKAHLLGHSMGGKVAIAFALDYPEKILSLTVADITPKNYLRTPASAIQYDFHKKILAVLGSIDLSLFSSRKDIEKILENQLPEKFVRQFILKNLQRKDKKFEWKINVPVISENLEHIIEGVDSNEYLDRIPITNYPVLFIKGELSKYIQEEDKAIILKMFPDSKMEIIKNATHFLHAEKPIEFEQILT